MFCSSLLPNPTPQTSASPLCVLTRGSPDTHKLRRYRVLSTNGLLRLSESQGYDAPWWPKLEASLPCPGGEPVRPGCWGSGCRTRFNMGPPCAPPTRRALHPSPPEGSVLQRRLRTRELGASQLLALWPHLLHCFALSGGAHPPKSQSCVGILLGAAQPCPRRALSSQRAPHLSWSLRRPPSRQPCGQWPAPQQCRWR